MINLGYKNNYSEAKSIGASKPANEVMYPRFDLGSEYGTGPEINLGKLDVGKEMTATVKLRVKQVAEKTGENGKTRRYYNFDVLAIDLPNQKSAEDMKKDRLQAATKTYGG